MTYPDMAFALAAHPSLTYTWRVAKATDKTRAECTRGNEAIQSIRLLRTISGHQRDIQDIAFDPTGQTLATVSRDGTLKLWKTANGDLLRTIEGHESGILSVAFDRTGKVVASGGADGRAKLWSVTSGSQLGTLGSHGASVWSVKFDPTGQVLASGSGDGIVGLWEVTTGKLIFALKGQRCGVLSVAFDPTGKMLISGSRDQTAKLWDTATGRLIGTFEGHQDWVLGVTFDPVGRTFASASHDHTVKIWDVTSGGLLSTLKGHTDTVEVVAFSPDGRFLASKSSDGTVRIWNHATTEMVAIINEPTNPDHWIPALAFHPKLPQLATVGSEPFGFPLCRLVHFWELDTDVLLAKETPLPQSYEPIQMPNQRQPEAEEEHHTLSQRTRFEQTLLRVQTYVEKQEIKPPSCFISYAWGDPQHEQWVEQSLATDLQKAGITVVLDRWENARIGKSVPRFIDRVATTDRVLVVGTPLYRRKYSNDEPMRPFVVAAEGDLIGKRMIGAEAGKECVLPILLAGTEETSFPPLLQGRVYADFRDDRAYFTTALDQILSLYQIPFNDKAVADLRESLRKVDPGMHSTH